MEDSGTESVTSDFFNSPIFADSWSIQSWSQAVTDDTPIYMVNSPQNIYIHNSSSPTHLTLRTTRLETFQSAGEINSNSSTIFYGSIRTRARISGSAGAVASIFTFADNTNESDIEILTRDLTGEFHATNQPGLNREGNAIPGASSMLIVPDGDREGDGMNSEGLSSGGSSMNASWTDWNVWRLDWVQGKTEWFVNEVSVDNKTIGVPWRESSFVLNMWGNRGEWSGNMSVGGEARMDVEWVEMLYNTSDQDAGTLDGRGCEVVCTLDASGVVGVQQMMPSMASSWLLSGMGWRGIVCMLLAVLLPTSI
ncbi:hypothetical protein MMC25_005591 [Agyrium rufum]|nr:hypothetical protein [Agyrium rufum]